MYEFKDGKHVIVEKVTIERTPSEVFEFVATPENIPLFWSSIIDYKRLSDELEKGARAEATLKIAGKKFNWIAELIEFEPDEQMMWRSLEAPFPFTYEYRFEPMGDATTVTYWIESEDLPGFFSIANKLVGRMFAREVHANLLHLKDLLESEF